MLPSFIEEVKEVAPEEDDDNNLVIFSDNEDDLDYGDVNDLNNDYKTVEDVD